MSFTPIKKIDIASQLPFGEQLSGSDPDKDSAPEGRRSRAKRAGKTAGTAEAYELQLSRLRKRVSEQAEKRNAQIDSLVLQEAFPFWTDDQRGVPNPFIRSGLFGVKISTQREFIENASIESLSNYQITYTGRDLQQDDLSVWMSLINMARQRPMSDMVLFTGYQLIKDLGWRMHSESYDRAKKSIERLKVTGLTISTRNDSSGYSGSLIREYMWDHKDEEGTTRWMVRFEAKVSMLFMQDTTSFVEWEQRKQLGTRSPIALWLHAFYTSHRDPIPYSIGKLHELSRSDSTLSTFRRGVKAALEKMIDIGFLKEFDLVNDVVYVKKASVMLVKASDSSTKGRAAPRLGRQKAAK